MHAGDFAFAQIDAACGIEGKRRRLDRGQGQPLRLSDREALRQHCADGKIVAQDGDVARGNLALQHVDGCLGIDHGRERDSHPLHVLFGSDGGGRINLRGFFGQISFLCEDSQIDAVILEAQIRNALRIRGKIDVCRVLDDKAQHARNLLAGLGPGDLLGERKHFAGGLPLAVDRFGQAREAAGGEDGDRQDRRKEFSHQCLHFRPPNINGRLTPLSRSLDLIPSAKPCCTIAHESKRR